MEEGWEVMAGGRKDLLKLCRCPGGDAPLSVSSCVVVERVALVDHDGWLDGSSVCSAVLSLLVSLAGLRCFLASRLQGGRRVPGHGSLPEDLRPSLLLISKDLTFLRKQRHSCQ